MSVRRASIFCFAVVPGLTTVHRRIFHSMACSAFRLYFRTRIPDLCDVRLARARRSVLDGVDVAHRRMSMGTRLAGLLVVLTILIVASCSDSTAPEPVPVGNPVPVLLSASMTTLML